MKEEEIESDHAITNDEDIEYVEEVEDEFEVENPEDEIYHDDEKVIGQGSDILASRKNKK